MQTLGPMIERSRHNPYEIGIAVALLVLSIYGLAFTPASNSLDSGLTPPMRLGYGLLTLAGSVLSLGGLWLQKRDEHLGLIIESVGQLFLGAGAATFVVVLWHVSPSFSAAGLVTGTAAGIAVAALCRVVQIVRDVRRWVFLIRAAAELERTLDELKGLSDES